MVRLKNIVQNTLRAGCCTQRYRLDSNHFARICAMEKKFGAQSPEATAEVLRVLFAPKR